MSSGAKVISAFIRETVAGTTPASGDWSLLKRTSWGVKPTQNKGENNEIGGSRMAQGGDAWHCGMSAVMLVPNFAGVNMMIFLHPVSARNGQAIL
ncbi:Uncharacterised protein [Escherichia coli]|nr:Uncharacterised protein [Escherichia coli]